MNIGLQTVRFKSYIDYWEMSLLNELFDIDQSQGVLAGIIEAETTRCSNQAQRRSAKDRTVAHLAQFSLGSEDAQASKHHPKARDCAGKISLLRIERWNCLRHV